MIELKGKVNQAKVFTDEIESTAISQIIELCSQEFTRGSKIRIMPDVHAGKGCTIGTTMTITDKIVANLVGVDIGCGMLTVKLSDNEINFEKLDKVIMNNIPSGMNVRNNPHKLSENIKLSDLKCYKNINENRARLAIGTLGGGNHFIEVNKGTDDSLYIVIHSGSRYLGKQVAEYYQKLAISYHKNNKEKRDILIKELKKQGRESEISNLLKEIKDSKIKDDLCFLEGDYMKDYLHDITIVQQFAETNREAMMNEIIVNMGLTIVDKFTTIHNYVDTKEMILRKGAISSKKNEITLIPINMRDGSLICKGKGNPDWNYSAPHGGGRLMSRSKAKELVSLEEFKDTMKGVWSTSVCQSTLDESPFAYKSIENIIDNIGDTAEIIDIIKPLYNFKSH